jgi:hypothetical protein
MRRRLPLILALILPLAAMAMWVRSDWRFDFIQDRGVVALSESGAVYAYPIARGGAFGYLTGVAGGNGRLEVETGSAWRPWLPFWTWTYKGDRFFVVQWWTVAAASTVPVWWLKRRRRREGTRGFEVGTVDSKIT